MLLWNTQNLGKEVVLTLELVFKTLTSYLVNQGPNDKLL